MAKWRCGYMPQRRRWRQTRLESPRQHPLPRALRARPCPRLGRSRYTVRTEGARLPATLPRRTFRQRPTRQTLFPKGFHRGFELFGQQASRLKEPGYREFIQQHGLILVEGFNDVINLDTFGIPALAIMSNRMTEAQGEKVIRFAKQPGINRVNLMFDCEDPHRVAAVDGCAAKLSF